MSESAGCPVRLPAPLMLAHPIRVLPAAAGVVYEAKLDGVRALYGAGRLWSRHHKQLHVPEVIAAARGLGDGVVLDGELVVFAADGRCDFPAVCRRLHSPAPPAVTYVAFDLLAAAGRDLRALPYRHRRLRLTDLLADPAPHLQLMPATDDVAEAADWYASPLVEGLVIKPVEAPYPRVRDQRRWQKLRRQHTLTLLAVGLHGSPPAPCRVLLGAYAGPELRLVGATLPLPADAPLPLTVCAGPRTVPGWLLGGLPGRHCEPAAYLPVDPFPVDVAADTAIDGGIRLRHCPPLLRSRPDVDPTTVTLPLPPT